MFTIQRERMIETSSQYRRWAAVLLGCPKHRDGVRGTCLIMGGIEMNLPVEPQKPARDRDQTRGQQPAQNTARGPGFPAGVGGICDLHAAFPNESRFTRLFPVMGEAAVRTWGGSGRTIFEPLLSAAGLRQSRG